MRVDVEKTETKELLSIPWSEHVQFPFIEEKYSSTDFIARLHAAHAGSINSIWSTSFFPVHFYFLPLFNGQTS